MVTRSSFVQRVTVAALARLLPADFRQRQCAEWTADLLDLPGRQQRVRYLVSAARTLPELRALVRAGRPSWYSPRSLRAGLGRPGTSGIVVLAALVAVLGAIFGAAGATRVGWEFARPLPTGPEAEQLTSTAFPGVRVISEEARPPWGHSKGEATGYEVFVYAIDPADEQRAGALVPGVFERLSAAGWQSVPHLYDNSSSLDADEGADVRMVRDGLVLEYNTLTAGFSVARAVPPWMGWVAAAGGIGGALVGWLLTGWAGRRAVEGSVVGRVSGQIIWPTTVGVLSLILGDFLLLRSFGDTNADMFFRQLLYLAEGPYPWTLTAAAVAFGVVAVPSRRARMVRTR